MGLPLKVSVLQQADRIIFAPVCLVLTAVRRLTGGADASATPDPKSILFVKLAEQGSTVLAAGAIRRAVERVGRQNVYFVVFEENRFILDLMGLVPAENVITVPTQSTLGMARGALGALRLLRRRRIDAAVDLEFFARFSAVFTFLSGAKWRVGLHPYFGEGPYRGDLMTHRVIYNPHLHTSQMFGVLVEALRVAADKLPTFDVRIPPFRHAEPTFFPDADEQSRVRALLPAGSARLVLLNPNAGDMLPLRRWPEDRYAALAAGIVEALPDATVVMTGTAEEAGAARALVERVGSPRCLSLAGRTTLRELLVLYTIADVLVSNDSGPAHFAALTPIDVITLFGPETPALFATLSPHSVAISAGIACSPCINALNNRQSACRDNRCMQAIGVDEVLAEVVTRFRARASR
ncbi:MAG TPA: glycosyltransferase family 9 protein [Candidatus Polarisedimenticolaceae bacterium]|nr:glycosyltransferase family 9 protein [Candidatus Polarisedimenticolaceae bacterium]